MRELCFSVQKLVDNWFHTHTSTSPVQTKPRTCNTADSDYVNSKGQHIDKLIPTSGGLRPRLNYCYRCFELSLKFHDRMKVLTR